MSGIMNMFVAAKTTIATAVDEFFNRVTLLLNTGSTNGAQNNTFLDSSTNNFTITRNGNTTQGTFTPFSQTGWSNYFDGTGDYLSGSSNTALDFGTGSFTVELWVYHNVLKTYSGLIGGKTGGTTGSPINIYTYADGHAGITFDGTGEDAVTVAGVFIVGKWQHVALVRSGNSFTFYVDGVSKATGTSANASTLYNNLGWGIGSTAGTGDLNGYISNARVLKGTALYTGTFTPSTTPLTAITNTSLLTCQDNRFVDESANNFAITTNGTPSVQAFSPFAPNIVTPTTYSNLFNGSTGYLTAPSNSAFAFGTGSFTWETWFYSTGTYATGDDCFYDLGSANTAGGFAIFITGGLLYVRINGTGQDLTYSLTASWVNTWHHLAVVRNGTTLTIYLDGVSVASGTRAQDVTQSTPYIGNGAGVLASYYFAGLLSNMRVVKGTAVYTANFTPPTAPLTNITNTSLLTCQSSTLIDNSTNNFTITANGNVRPVASPAPFDPLVTLNTAYSTSVVGGSGYFDGTGDYLTAAANAAFTLPGDFTIDGWFYHTAQATQYYGVCSIGAYTNGIMLRVESSASVWYLNPFVNGTTMTFPNAALKVSLNTWNHFAVVRSGTTVTTYFNGVLAGTMTVSGSVNTTPGVANIGTNDLSQPWIGYISGLRLVKGTALYTSSFASPLAPPTPVTNTQLLLSGTNAGIYDATAKNVLETVGNAQVSTTQAKWGTTAIAFDGTGDYLFQPNNQSYNLGSGNFTIEMWLYVPSLPSAYKRIFSISNAAVATNSDEGVSLEISNTNKMTGALFSGATAYGIADTNNITAATWEHWALVRNGVNLTLYRNGVSVSTSGTLSTVSMNFTSSFNLIIGKWGSSTARDFNGYIDDLRVTKGYARYTANFTAPTAAFPVQ